MTRDPLEAIKGREISSYNRLNPRGHWNTWSTKEKRISFSSRVGALHLLPSPSATMKRNSFFFSSRGPPSDFQCHYDISTTPSLFLKEKIQVVVVEYVPVVFLQWRFTNSDVVLLFDILPDPVKSVTFVHQGRVETAFERHVLADPDVHGQDTAGQQQQKGCKSKKKRKR